MAIIVEEQKRGISIVTVITWLVILAVLSAAAYYIFFARPELVEVTAPSSFQNINSLSQININPDDVVQSLNQSFKQYITPPATTTLGRSNPFSPF